MFAGRTLAFLAGTVVVVTSLVIFLEWRALSGIVKKGPHGHGDLPGLIGDQSRRLFQSMSPLLERSKASGGDLGANGTAGGSKGSLRGARDDRPADLPLGMIPPFPTPQEVRHPECVQRDGNYDLAALPKASLVIPYLNETWAHISATVGSILAHTPAEILDEILFVDDGNDKEWMFHEQLTAIDPRIRIHRNDERQGLIRSKVIGAALIKSPILVFMEPHCVVVRHWLEPLLEQLQASAEHNTLVMPILDIIPENNFNQYRVANHHIGGFDWSLTFNWMTLVEERNKTYRYPEPYPTPALSGGIFGIWRDYWDRMGTYDTNMTEWGGEHIEMSLRTWRCGGKIEVVPCSRIGHVFRQKNPYVVHPARVIRNTKRAALVWLDNRLEDFYKSVPAARRMDAGDVEERIKLKESLKCHSMDWFVDNVYPELKGTQPRHR